MYTGKNGFCALLVKWIQLKHVRCERLIWFELKKTENQKAAQDHIGLERSDKERTKIRFNSRLRRANEKTHKKMRGSTAGLSDFHFEKRNTFHDALLAFLDVVFASAIVTPAILVHWRGTWNLWKMFVFPDDLFSSGITFMCIGTIGQFTVFYAQNILDRTFHPDKHRLTFMVVSRLYTFTYSIIGIAGWRGLWDVLDFFFPPSTIDISMLCAVIVIGAILLALFKGLRNVSSPPFGISTDNSKDYFIITTMFKSSVRRESNVSSYRGLNFYQFC